ncbi:MAG: helix-turn-helix domain-containing protein [Desulfobacterales bacterium]|nr:helix-turn-helix domain-containing protein [Desulfobacterales bacterium]
MINKNSLSFGYYLKAIRVEKGISLDEVSEKTRIGINYLLLIEKEDHNRLPSEVFVKGFLRAYAEAVGVDGDEAVRRYTSSLNAYQANVKSEADFDNLSTRFWPHLLLSLGAMICIIVLSVFAMSVFHSPLQTDSQVNTNTGDDNNKTGKGIDNIASKVDLGSELDSNLVDKQSKKSLLLSIITIETTWIKVIIDGRMPKEYSLKPGDRFELEASAGFNLLIGNATGVQLILNDKPIEVLGKRGHVVNIQLP